MCEEVICDGLSADTFAVGVTVPSCSLLFRRVRILQELECHLVICLSAAPCVEPSGANQRFHDSSARATLVDARMSVKLRNGSMSAKPRHLENEQQLCVQGPACIVISVFTP